MRTTQQLLTLSVEELNNLLATHHAEISRTQKQITDLRSQLKELDTPVAEVEKPKKKKDKKDKKDKSKKKNSPQNSSTTQQRNSHETKVASTEIKYKIKEAKRAILNRQLAIIQTKAIIETHEFYAAKKPVIVEAPVNPHLCAEYRDFLASLNAYQQANAENNLVTSANALKTYYENDSSDDAKKYLIAAKNILDDNSEAHRKALTDLISDDFNEAAGKWTKLIAIGTMILGAACVLAGVALFPVSILIPTLFPLIAAAVGLVPIGAGLISAGQSNLNFMANRISVHETQTRYISQFSVAASGLFAPANDQVQADSTSGLQLR